MPPALLLAAWTIGCGGAGDKTLSQGGERAAEGEGEEGASLPPGGEGEGEGEGEGGGGGEGPVKPPDPDPRPCVDGDLDGYGDHCELGPDCNDRDPRVNPGGLEVCNGIDDDCDVAVDESDPHLGADCDVEAAGCDWPGRFTCLEGVRVCQAGRPVTPGLHPHIAPMSVGWAIAWLAPGRQDPNILQVFTAPLTDDGELGAAGTRLTRSSALSAGPPVAIGGEGRVEAVYLGSPGRGSSELHLMHARADDSEPRSLAPLDPTPDFPEAWRPSLVGQSATWWDGRTAPGGIRWQPLVGEGLTVAGGAARWPHLAVEDAGVRLTFIRSPGEIRTMLLDDAGGMLEGEELLATDDGPVRPAQAAGAWVWLRADGAVRLLAEREGGVETIDPFGEQGLDPAAVAVDDRPLVAWTRATFNGPQIVVWSPQAREGARVLGPGAGPVLTVGEPGVALVFDRGGRVHFAPAVCP